MRAGARAAEVQSSWFVGRRKGVKPKIKKVGSNDFGRWVKRNRMEGLTSGSGREGASKRIFEGEAPRRPGRRKG